MDLALARRLRATGGTVEEVIALDPEVVVSGTFIGAATRHALERAGIRVELLPIPATVEESEAQVRALARLAGNRAGGEAMIGKIEQALAAGSPPPGEQPVEALVWQSGGIVPGANTLIADLLGRTGFVSYSARRGMRQADFLPLENVLAQPPALILAAGDAHGEEDRMLAHPVLGGLTNTRREKLDASLLYCGGPTIVRAARRLAEVRRSLADRDASGGARRSGGSSR